MQNTLTLNWENCDFASEGEEESKTMTDSECNLQSKLIQDENEQKKMIQLQKFQDPNKDGLRKGYIAAASRFGDLIGESNGYEDFEDLITSDFEAFLFNFADLKPVVFTCKPQDLLGLYKEAHLVKRQMKESYVDLEQATAIQICYCEIRVDRDQEIIPQFSLEIFSFKGDKISKYRASFGCSTSFNEFHNPFTPTRKDLMLAKVKELNFAWAGQPNLEKIASLFDASTEYKIWCWENQKGYTFYKENLVSGFKKMEENYELKCVVPYDAFSEGQFIIGNYVYHLESKAGEKYIWLSTCIYTFDKYLNIAKINQQGELYLENEIQVPYPASCREKVKKEVIAAHNAKINFKNDWHILGTDNFLFGIELTRFCPKYLSTIDHVNGFQEFEKLSQIFESRCREFEWAKILDFYIDHSDPSYDVIFFVECTKPAQDMENYDDSRANMVYYTMKKMCIENGKVAKLSIFFSEILEPIPSPYDDKTFTAENIKRKEDFFI